MKKSKSSQKPSELRNEKHSVLEPMVRLPATERDVLRIRTGIKAGRPPYSIVVGSG